LRNLLSDFRFLSNEAFTPLSLSKLGELFEMDFSAVSQVAKRFEQKSKVNHEIKENMQKVITTLKKYECQM
jgi:chromosomal replication initiation ATPase DnaA